MSAISDVVISMFSFAFIVRALIVGFLVSLCASLLGVSLVLKRYSMIGDGLSHVGFGSLAIASALNMAPLAVSIPLVVAAAFLLLRLNENSRIKGDAAVALFSTGALAIGVMIISMTTGMNTDVCNYLFGSILAMSKADARLSVVLAVPVIVFFVFFYNKIFAVTFDETFAKASGVRTGLYNTIIAVLTALTIVLGMRMMGALLISSLIIFPALSSMRLFTSFRSVTISSAVISICCFFAGIVVSYVFETPTGASVVLFNMAVFAVFSSAAALRRAGRVSRKAVLAAGLIFVLGGCSKITALSTPKNAAGTRAVELSEGTRLLDQEDPQEDIDREKAGKVIEIKEKMFIAQTSDIWLNPEDYLNKTIKLEGLFKTEPAFDKTYCFVLRYGPGCCGNDSTAGLEVAWPDTVKKNYPQEDDWVEARGKLKYYEENGYFFPYLSLDSLAVKMFRGSEYVSR